MKESFLLAKPIHSTNTLEVLHSQWVPEVEKTMQGAMQCQVNWAGNRSRQEEVAGSYIKTWIEKGNFGVAKTWVHQRQVAGTPGSIGGEGRLVPCVKEKTT